MTPNLTDPTPEPLAMTPTAKWEAMSERERDAAVAERVMGIKPRAVRVRGTTDETVLVFNNNSFFQDGACDRQQLECYGSPPKYTTDYAVLCHVREKWTPKLLYEFYRQANLIWALRATDERPIVLLFEAGDWSRAAYLTATAKDTP